MPAAVPSSPCGDGQQQADYTRVADLVRREAHRTDATGAMVPRPAADVAYRLAAWYGVRVTAAEVAALLAAGR